MRPTPLEDRLPERRILRARGLVPVEPWVQNVADLCQGFLALTSYGVEPGEIDADNLPYMLEQIGVEAPRRAGR